MSNQQYNQVPFWDFINSFDPNHAPGGGVDHTSQAAPHFPPGFPFGPGGLQASGEQASAGEFGGWGPWGFGRGQGRGGRGRRGGRGGRGGHPGHRHADNNNDYDDYDRAHERGGDGVSGSDSEMDGQTEKAHTPDTMQGDAPDPAVVTPGEDDQPSAPPRAHGGGPCGGPRGGRGGRGGCHRGRRFEHRGPHQGPHHGHHRQGPGPGGFFAQPHSGGPGGPPFDFADTIRGFAQHPFFQNLRDNVGTYRNAQNNDNNGNNGNGDSNDTDAFVPPVDMFNTEQAYVLHVALPGAKKEDIGVNWDADGSVLNIAGVIHRPGDEQFLQTLASGERRIGMFERNVPIPPAGAKEKDEVDGQGITAKMEEGILIVTVPKVEKEWTEIRKVDIE